MASLTSSLRSRAQANAVRTAGAVTHHRQLSAHRPSICLGGSLHRLTPQGHIQTAINQNESIAGQRVGVLDCDEASCSSPSAPRSILNMLRHRYLTNEEKREAKDLQLACNSSAALATALVAGTIRFQGLSHAFKSTKARVFAFAEACGVSPFVLCHVLKDKPSYVDSPHLLKEAVDKMATLFRLAPAEFASKILPKAPHLLTFSTQFWETKLAQLSAYFGVGTQDIVNLALQEPRLLDVSMSSLDSKMDLLSTILPLSYSELVRAVLHRPHLLFTDMHQLRMRLQLLAQGACTHDAWMQTLAGVSGAELADLLLENNEFVLLRLQYLTRQGAPGELQLVDVLSLSAEEFCEHWSGFDRWIEFGRHWS